MPLSLSSSSVTPSFSVSSLVGIIQSLPPSKGTSTIDRRKKRENFGAHSWHLSHSQDVYVMASVLSVLKRRYKA